MLIHSKDGFDHHVRGKSIIVGIIIFSIVGGLDFGHNRCRKNLRL